MTVEILKICCISCIAFSGVVANENSLTITKYQTNHGYPAAYVDKATQSTKVNNCQDIIGKWQGVFAGFKSEISFMATQRDDLFKVSYIDQGQEKQNLVFCVEGEQSFKQITLVYEPVFGGYCLGQYSQKYQQLWSVCQGSPNAKAQEGWYWKVNQ